MSFFDNFPFWARFSVLLIFVAISRRDAQVSEAGRQAREQ